MSQENDAINENDSGSEDQPDDSPNIDKLTEELKTARAEKDKAAKIARKHQERLKTLENKLKEYESADNERLEKDSSSEAQQQLIDRLKERVAAVEEERDEALGSVRNHILKDKVKALSKKVIAEHAFEDVFALFGEQFDLDESGAPIVKGGIDSVDEFLREIAQEKPYFSAARPASGSGPVKPAEGTKPTDGITIDDLRKMNKQDRVAALAKNPALQKEWFMTR